MSRAELVSVIVCGGTSWPEILRALEDAVVPAWEPLVIVEGREPGTHMALLVEELGETGVVLLGKAQHTNGEHDERGQSPRCAVS